MPWIETLHMCSQQAEALQHHQGDACSRRALPASVIPAEQESDPGDDQLPGPCCFRCFGCRSRGSSSRFR